MFKHIQSTENHRIPKSVYAILLQSLSSLSKQHFWLSDHDISVLRRWQKIQIFGKVPIMGSLQFFSRLARELENNTTSVTNLHIRYYERQFSASMTGNWNWNVNTAFCFCFYWGKKYKISQNSLTSLYEEWFRISWSVRKVGSLIGLDDNGDLNDVYYSRVNGQSQENNISLNTFNSAVHCYIFDTHTVNRSTHY